MCIECLKNYRGFVWKHFVSHKACSVRKKLAFRDATTGFPPQMSSEKRAQKFYTEVASLPRSG